MKLKYLVLTWILVEVLCFVGVARATCDDTTFYVNDSYYGLMVESSAEKSDQKKSEVPPVEKSSEGISIDPYHVLGGLAIGTVFFFFCKFTFLVLELTSYEKFWNEKNDYTHLDGTLCSHNYPEINPWQYLFNFKKWRLKQILDPFTYDAWQKWYKEQSIYDFSNQ